MQKNQQRPIEIHKPRKQQHPQNPKSVTNGDSQIHHKTQKTTASTKPKISDRRRPTDSPKNPEKQQHPPSEIQRQHHKTQNWTKSQPSPATLRPKSREIE